MIYISMMNKILVFIAILILSFFQPENNQFINLTEKVIVSGCKRLNQTISGRDEIHCKGSRNFNTARDRWWFIAASNCESAKGLSLYYKFLMTNGPKDDILHHHFSADEFYLLPILLTASVIHMLILFMSLWSAIVLKARHLFHATYKLYLMLIFLHVSRFCLFVTKAILIQYHGGRRWHFALQDVSRRQSCHLSTTSHPRF